MPIPDYYFLNKLAALEVLLILDKKSLIAVKKVLNSIILLVFLRNDRITIKAIGVGNVVSMDELDCISSPNQTETTKDFSTLPDIKNQLVDVACDIPVGKMSALYVTYGTSCEFSHIHSH